MTEARMPMGRLETDHVDMIYDMKMDYHSKHIATCSSDRTVRIYQASTKGSVGTMVACLQVPCEGAVWRIAWSHPKFNVLAASTQCGKIVFFRNRAPVAAPEDWVQFHVATPHGSSINSIDFAPHEYGLMLASASADGTVVIMTMTREGWLTTSSIRDNDQGCMGVSWAPYNSLGGQGFKRVVVGGCDSMVKIWTLNDADSSQIWQRLDELPTGHTDWVRDVLWAPSSGMPCNTIASCSDDHRVLIWTQVAVDGPWTCSIMNTFSCPVYRLSWSITGNVLCVAAGEDQVTLWKDVDGTWQQLSSIQESHATVNGQ
ncbi:transport protein SEC13 [Thraustotheca clavata]|uniref:Transport protein SEC13 n=1 Tax=Thraustotheca clavata TaxID=74557 RepID=A0A1V9ZDE2_9STRA|nr:transport protein SEC13 [Thraustotheca clavata]